MDNDNDTDNGGTRAAALTALLADTPDPTDHERVRKYLHRLAELGCAPLLIMPNTKQPFEGRTPRRRITDDKAAQQMAREAGRRNWQRVKSAAGVHLATDDPAVLDGYLDQYIEAFGADCAVNVAAAVGPSRLVVVDCDTAAQVATFMASGDPDTPPVPTVRTPGQVGTEGTADDPDTWAHRDGGHWWFTVPDDAEALPANSGAMTCPPGDDGYAVLWHHRYVLIPPSVRPEGAYAVAGAVYELPDWLRDKVIVYAQQRSERAERNRSRAKRTHDDNHVTVWGADTLWAAILAPTAWMNTGKSDGCGCDIWTAPGLHGVEKSATAHEPGCTAFPDSPDPCLHIWTDHDIEPFGHAVAEHGSHLTRLRAYAAIHHDDDIGAAMEYLDLHAEPTTLGPRRDDGQADSRAGNGNGKEQTNNGRVIWLRSMSEIVDDAPTWAWEYGGHGRIMRGTLVILGGRPAAGKSTAARWFAAGFSRGTLDGCFHGQSQTVAYVGTEESYEHLVKPGLRAVGADMDRVKQVIVQTGEQETRLLAADDEDALTAELLAEGVTVVIVDPLMSTINGKTDIYRNNETREVLEPWARIAQAINGVVIGVAHLVKSPNGDVLAAIQGSSAFGEVARGVFGFAKDDNKSIEDGEGSEGSTRIMSQVKNSAGREDLSVQYRVIDTEVVTDTGKTASVGRFEITGTSDRTVADVMRDQARNGGASRGAGAEVGMWLGKYLANGPRWAAQGYDDAQRAGFSKDQIKRGRKSCGIESLKAKGTDSRWYWATEEQIDDEQLPADPEPTALVDVPPPAPAVAMNKIFGSGPKARKPGRDAENR